jgi:hypothetical protein
VTNSARVVAINKTLVYPVPDPCYTNQNLHVVLCQIALSPLRFRPISQFIQRNFIKYLSIPSGRYPRSKQTKSTATLVPNSQPHENGSNRKESRMIIFLVYLPNHSNSSMQKLFVFPYSHFCHHRHIRISCATHPHANLCANVTM